jgi:hypothetical protein
MTDTVQGDDRQLLEYTDRRIMNDDEAFVPGSAALGEGQADQSLRGPTRHMLLNYGGKQPAVGTL